MHLTCPSCGATFLVEPEHLGPTGRRVRCGECGHTWHQERPSEADAAERSEAKAAAAPFAPSEPTAEPAADQAPEPAAEPAAKPAAEPAPEPAAEPAAKAAAEPAAKPAAEPAAKAAAEPGLEPAGEPAPEPAAEPEPEPAPEPVDIGERGPRRTASKPPRRARARREASLAAGWILFLVVVTGLAAGFYFGRAQLVAMVPQMTRLYDLVGLSAESAELGLELRDVKSVRRLVDGDRVVVIEGLVVNVSGQTRRVPPLRASLTDAEGEELDRWTFEAVDASLAPGEATEFETVAKNPPREGNLSIDFVVEK
jgi:predicted Zn finger-like uncharacterized protein